ncbi:MAG TPA: hypothetical protein VK003_09450 [Oceanobacillus sp.]|nr:hypothetical protein [Oceanobacillus sp.]
MDWIEQIQARGLEQVFCTALDVLEPFGPLGAQLIWVAQPAARVIGQEFWGNALTGLAEALEEPGGVMRLRERLEGQQGG